MGTGITMEGNLQVGRARAGSHALEGKPRQCGGPLDRPCPQPTDDAVVSGCDQTSGGSVAAHLLQLGQQHHKPSLQQRPHRQPRQPLHIINVLLKAVHHPGWTASAEC